MNAVLDLSTRTADVSTILVVDDDAHIREVVTYALHQQGYETVEAANGKEALAVFRDTSPDLVVLDILMPELDGTAVCQAIRKSADTPIVFLTSKDDEIDRIVGLELGGDDYVAKPFSPRELVARIRAVLRRGTRLGEPEAAGAELTQGDLSVDVERYEVHWQGTALDLTLTEFGILRTLLEAPGRVFSRDELMDRAYAGYRVVSERTIDSHVRRLRAKFRALGVDPVVTVHGVGYRYSG